MDTGIGLDKYMTDIGETDLLATDEERALAARVRAGGGPDGPFTEDAQDAINTLVVANLRLVVEVAARSRGMREMDEAIQDGNLGLIRAAQMYNGSYRFSTYAWAWVQQHISRGRADTERLVRLPVHLNELQSRIRRARARLEQVYGRDPTVAELAADLNVAERRVAGALAAERPTLSLHQPMNGTDGEEGATFEAFIGCMPIDAVDERLEREEVRAVLAAALAALPERDRAILKRRYGWDDDTPTTLETAGAAHGITRERARQVAGEALVRLRQHPALVAWRRREQEAA